MTDRELSVRLALALLIFWGVGYAAARLVGSRWFARLLNWCRFGKWEAL